MHGFLVYANDAVATLFEEHNDLTPAIGIGPVFTAAAALHGDDGIGFLDRAGFIGQRELGRLLGGIDAEDVPGGAMQSPPFGNPLVANRSPSSPKR